MTDSKVLIGHSHWCSKCGHVVVYTCDCSDVNAEKLCELCQRQAEYETRIAVSDRRFQAAVAAMQGLLSRAAWQDGESSTALTAVGYADALLAILEEGK